MLYMLNFEHTVQRRQLVNELLAREVEKFPDYDYDFIRPGRFFTPDFDLGLQELERSRPPAQESTLGAAH